MPSVSNQYEYSPIDFDETSRQNAMLELIQRLRKPNNPFLIYKYSFSSSEEDFVGDHNSSQQTPAENTER